MKGPAKPPAPGQPLPSESAAIPELSPLPELDPLASALPSGGLLDNLLNDATLSSPALSQGSLLSGAGLTPTATKSPKKSRWDSPWFLIFVGILLALGVIGLFLAWRMLT